MPDDSPYRPMDERRAREIKRWLQGERTDAPSRDEVTEFADWVADRIERDLTRHSNVSELLEVLNVAREVLRDPSALEEDGSDGDGERLTAPDGSAGHDGGRSRRGVRGAGFEAGPVGDDDGRAGGDSAIAASDPGDPFPPRTDEEWMDEALREAARAAAEGEVPVGALVLGGGRVLGRGRNQRERLHDPTAHAEMIALTQAAAALGTWRLDGCTMVVTLEPCPMCAGALVNARVGRLVYGADDPKAGACGTLFDLVNDPRLNHRLPVTSGVRREECGEILREFFRARRG